MKTFYFRRTQRGGISNAAGKSGKLQLLPVGRWLQHRVIWLCGHDGERMESWIADNPEARRSGDLNTDEEESDEEGEEMDVSTGMEGFI